MAKLDFNDIGSSSTGNSIGVSYFSLKNDGEEAIVRIMQDSIDSFELLTVHDIQVGNRHRKINCCRESAMDDISKCPLCAQNAPIQKRFFIHLLQYTKAADGSINVEAKVWERSAQYASTLKSYLDNYGPLSDIMCKIIRHGRPGDMSTTYEIVPNLNKQIYRDDLYPKKAELFDNYTVVGHIVMDKTFSDISQFLQTGQFPSAADAAPMNAAPSYAPPAQPQTPPPYNAAPAYAPAPQQTPSAPNTPPSYQAPATPQYTPQPRESGPMPWDNQGQAPTRPQRYY